MHFGRIIICLSLLFACSCWQAKAADPKPVHDFALKLEILNNPVKQGTVPRVRLTLTNTSQKAHRILDGSHGWYPYYDLILTKDGKDVDVPIAIEDPNVPEESDWIVVPPGKSKTFIFTRFPQAYEKLPPGSYGAYMKFWRDPFQDPATAYPAEKVKFTIIK